MLIGVTPRTRRLLFTVLKAGVSLALLAYLFSRVDVARLWQLARIGVDSAGSRRRSLSTS